MRLVQEVAKLPSTGGGVRPVQDVVRKARCLFCIEGEIG